MVKVLITPAKGAGDVFCANEIELIVRRLPSNTSLLLRLRSMFKLNNKIKIKHSFGLFNFQLLWLFNLTVIKLTII